MKAFCLAILCWLPLLWGDSVCGATKQQRYYAYPAVEDRYGVIAPWYTGQNGQCDFRIRISAETLKRYPWADAAKAPVPAPEYIYNGNWQISLDGAITIPPESDWGNGDLCQRAAFSLMGWVDYYRYTGDPAAIAHMTMIADVLLDFGQTGPDHPWPNFLISCPTKGKPYGQSDPHGMIQLDIVAQTGLGLVRAYECTGNARWLKAAEHWAELMAQKRNRDPNLSPWNRYANPEDVALEDMQTGGVAILLQFFDELIRLKHTGYKNCIVEARDAGQAYLRDVLLPRWTANDAWGRHYWDWSHPVQGVVVSDSAAHYIMSHRESFPNWRNDVRNILSLFLNHASVSPDSNADVYSGAWAYPEGSGCCGRSLDNAPPLMAPAFARYGILADSEWGRELARRQTILFTYDCHETGVVEDNIDGGQKIAATWFKAAHPGALKNILDVMAWLPEVLGANRENHIIRTSSVVRSVVYDKGRIRYATFDAPTDTIDVLRLAFVPTVVTCDGRHLSRREQLNVNGYHVKPLSGGDCIVSIRHDGRTNIVVEGEDPQEISEYDQLACTGDWHSSASGGNRGAGLRTASTTGATMTHAFVGNQIRLIGLVQPDGGLADVYIDDVKQLVGIDCWNPLVRDRQVLYYKNGLANTKHTLKVVVLGEKNPRSTGKNVYLQAVKRSAATGDAGFGEGGGPKEPQRLILGYTGRADYVDSTGHAWRPGTEFVVRAGHGADSVATSWWTTRRRLAITNTTDPELYRYGVHAQKFWVNFTVAPGTYDVRLKFTETRNLAPEKRTMTIYINGEAMLTDFDIAATAAGPGKAVLPTEKPRVWAGLNTAVDRGFNGIQPRNGIIEVRFVGGKNAEAICQAIEVEPVTENVR